MIKKKNNIKIKYNNQNLFYKILKEIIKKHQVNLYKKIIHIKFYQKLKYCLIKCYKSFKIKKT